MMNLGSTPVARCRSFLDVLRELAVGQSCVVAAARTGTCCSRSTSRSWPLKKSWKWLAELDDFRDWLIREAA
jgi:hypothetical protein